MSKYNYKTIITRSLIPLLIACSSLANAKAISGLDSPDPSEGGVIPDNLNECSDLLFISEGMDNNTCSEANELTMPFRSVTPPLFKADKSGTQY